MKKNTLKHVLGLLLLVTTVSASAESLRPDPELTHYLSSAGPLSVEEMKAVKHQKATHGRTLPRLSSNTYTYLRCYYHTSNNDLHPTTNYAWGIDPSSGGYYHLNGNWYSGSVFAWENMFYTQVPQATLQSVCQSTLKGKGIAGAPAMVFAADNSMSFNYTIWTNDLASQGASINKIIAFGDSLSDNQNMYNLSDWLIPDANTWFIGHFSNGYNWVEYVAANLNLPMYDWAVGDAAVTTTDLVIPSIGQQEKSWEAYMKSAPNYQPANTLFTMLIGGNDLVGSENSVATVIANETQTLQAMINAGARNILVMNLPDISKAPVFTIQTNGATVAAEVLDLNNQLATMVNTLQAQNGSSVTIRLFDTFTLFNSVIANPAAYGVTNTTASCLNINSTSALNYAETQSPRSICTNPDTFLFWDTLHPTTHTHKLLGAAVTSFIQANFGSISTTAMTSK
jgi:thermolabile hemolysin